MPCKLMQLKPSLQPPIQMAWLMSLGVFCAKYLQSFLSIFTHSQSFSLANYASALHQSNNRSSVFLMGLMSDK